MADYGSRVADKAIGSVEKKIRSVYRQAGEEIRKSMASFQKRHEAKQAVMLKKLENGEITKAAYDSWMRGQVFIGKQWQQKLDQTVKIMQVANKEAVSIVKDGKLDVFAENYNYAAYELEKKAKGSLGFNIYSSDSAGRLLKSEPQLLPEWRIDQKKDYIWNKQKVQNVITQGILQGKPIDKITDDLVANLTTTNESRMQTFARTAITGAQNAGRQKQMEDASEMGIKVKKRWLATLDSRTREAHQDLDGQEVDVNEPFTVDTEDGRVEIEFPGDPSCSDPGMIYNCRCTMIQIYPGIERVTTRRAYDDDENGNRDVKHSYTVENMTYKEWKAWKERGKQ